MSQRNRAIGGSLVGITRVRVDMEGYEDELQFFLDDGSNFSNFSPIHNLSVHKLERESSRQGALNPIAQQLESRRRASSCASDCDLSHSFGSSYGSSPQDIFLSAIRGTLGSAPDTARHQYDACNNKRRRGSVEESYGVYLGSSPLRTKSIKIGTSPNQWYHQGTPPNSTLTGSESSSYSSKQGSSGSQTPVKLWHGKNPTFNSLSPGVMTTNDSLDDVEDLNALDKSFQSEEGVNPPGFLERSDTVPFYPHLPSPNQSGEVKVFAKKSSDRQLRPFDQREAVSLNYYMKNVSSSFDPLQKEMTQMEIQ